MKYNNYRTEHITEGKGGTRFFLDDVELNNVLEAHTDPVKFDENVCVLNLKLYVAKPDKKMWWETDK